MRPARIYRRHVEYLATHNCIVAASKDDLIDLFNMFFASIASSAIRRRSYWIRACYAMQNTNSSIQSFVLSNRCPPRHRLPTPILMCHPYASDFVIKFRLLMACQLYIMKRKRSVRQCYMQYVWDGCCYQRCCIVVRICNLCMSHMHLMFMQLTLIEMMRFALAVVIFDERRPTSIVVGWIYCNTAPDVRITMTHKWFRW